MTSRLLTNSLIFFVGNLILSIFNYLYNTQMGRFLGPENYSVLGALIAFLGIVTMPTNAIATIAMRFTAHYHAKGDDGRIKTFFQRFTRKLSLLSIGVTAVFILVSPFLTRFLHLPSITPVLLIAPVLIFFVLLPLNRGILQGLQRFTASVINQTIDPILKLVLGLALVYLGLGVSGAVAAIVIASAVAYAFSYLPLRTILRQDAVTMGKMPPEVKQYSALALVAFLLATLLMNLDILLVKHFFEAREAGLYTALSTMGKIILFVTAPVVSVMFPMISDIQGRNEKHYRVLAQSFILVAFIGLVGVAGYYLFPSLVVTILYGPAYQEVAPLLGFFGVTMLLYSLINLWVNYFLSIGNRAFVWLLLLSAAAEVTLLWLRHESFVVVIQNLLIAMVTGFVGLTLYYFYLKRKQLAALIPSIAAAPPSS